MAEAVDPQLVRAVAVAPPEFLYSPFAAKAINWPAGLALLIGCVMALAVLRVGARVLKEFGITSCYTPGEPLLPIFARRSDLASPKSKMERAMPSGQSGHLPGRR